MANVSHTIIYLLNKLYEGASHCFESLHVNVGYRPRMLHRQLLYPSQIRSQYRRSKPHERSPRDKGPCRTQLDQVFKCCVYNNYRHWRRRRRKIQKKLPDSLKPSNSIGFDPKSPDIFITPTRRGSTVTP